MPLKTRDLESVEVLDAGTWDASTGSVTIDEDFLDQIVANTNELMALGVLAPPAKLGHPKNQKLLQQEGWPAAGWIRTLRREGTKVLADFAKVPEKLADLIEAGSYRKVSAEFWKEFGKIGGKGKKYGPVLTAVAFLGEEIPAVSTLGDMLKLFQAGMQPSTVALASDRDTIVLLEKKKSADADDADDFLRAAEEFVERAAERTKGKIGAPRLRAFLDEIKRRVKDIVGTKTEAALGDDESLQERERKLSDAVRRKYGSGIDGYSAAWVTETYDDYVIVDRSGKYFQVPYTLSDAGEVELGDPTEVVRSWKVAAAAAKHTFDVAGGEPEWTEVDASELPDAAFAVVDGDDRHYPHHFERDGTLYAHAGGIIAALARKDIPTAARAHLEDHARRAGIGEDEKEKAMANAAIAKALGLPEDADDAAVLAKIAEVQTAAASTGELKAKVDELAATNATRDATEKVNAAVRAGKIAPATRDFWVELAREKPTEFAAYVEKAPTLFDGSRGSENDAPDMSASAQLNKLANDRVAEQSTKGVKLSYSDALRQINREHPDLARQVVLERRGRASSTTAAN